MLKSIGLQLGFRTDPKKLSYFCVTTNWHKHKKITKETHRSPLFTRVACGPSRARTQKIRILDRPGFTRERERERERERVYKYLELPNI